MATRSSVSRSMEGFQGTETDAAAAGRGCERAGAFGAGPR